MNGRYMLESNSYHLEYWLLPQSGWSQIAWTHFVLSMWAGFLQKWMDFLKFVKMPVDSI